MPKNKLWTYVALVVMGILLIAAIRGCRKAKQEVNAKSKIQLIADSALAVIKHYKEVSDSTEKIFKDTIEFERGQNALLRVQREKTEAEMDVISKQNKELIAKHKLAQYTDTTAVLVPGEYLTDCENCFTNLETTNNLNNRYKNDINKLQDNWDKQTSIYQNRFKELEAEKLGFYNKINDLAKQQKDAASKLQPRGRLYLSWGVLWAPWPTAAGAGLMYQNKRNLIWGAKWYYGANGQMVETTINFPLSLKFK